MKRTSIILCLVLAGTAILHAETPTVTAVYGEAGTTSPLCPGGIAFIQGTNLGIGTIVTVGAKAAFVVSAFGGTSLQVQLPVDAPLGATTLKAGSAIPFNITLVPYSPGLPVNVPGSLAIAYHYPSGTWVTASFPAMPNEQIAVSATGLGATNPVYPTGTAPSDTGVLTVVAPTVNVAGKPATVQTAFLQPNSPGFYAVVFTMRADVTTGSQNINVSIGGLTSNTGMIPVSTGPVISEVTNAASYISVGPGRGIAQGGIFVIKGVNIGPATLVTASKMFQSNILSGTSVGVTVNGTTVAALMYYTSALQVAALLPSNTPTGAGTITVTYNGQASPASAILVVANSLGIFTVTSDGQGSGIVTYPDYSLVSPTKAANCKGVDTTCGAANPGDVLIIWATGLGPITGSDATGAGKGVNLTSIPLVIWLGNVQVTAVYQGRSGCCIGEDQIVFKVPVNSPTGCAVPLSVQIGNVVSNNVTLAVAPSGSRTCMPVNPAFTTARVAQISSVNSFTFGAFDLQRQDLYPGFQDTVHVQFLRASAIPAVRPFIAPYLDIPPLGTCQIYNSPDGKPDPPLTIEAGLNAGPQITVQGPNGLKAVTGSGGDYRTTLSLNGSYFTPGYLTLGAPGAEEVPGFITSITVPAFPRMTSPPPDFVNLTSVIRSNGLTVTWSGGSPTGFIQLNGFSNLDNSGNGGLSFQCSMSAAGGTFTVPPSVLLALPAGNFGGLDFQPSIIPASLPGTGLDLTQVTLRYDYFSPLSFR